MTYENHHPETEDLVLSINNCFAIIDKLDEEQILNFYSKAFFEIFVKYQNLIYRLFNQYCLGEKSSTGYCPVRKHMFGDELELRTFLQSNSEFINYDNRINELAEYIFDTSPFQNLNCMTPLSFSLLKDIRNYLAHESNSSYKKLLQARIIKEDRSIDEYFASSYRKRNKSYFIVIVQNIYDFSNYLIEGDTVDSKET